MGALVDPTRFEITLVEAKAFLGIPDADTTYDTLLQDLLIPSAIGYADDYLNNFFCHTDPDTGLVVEDPIPVQVKLGVLQLLSVMFNLHTEGTPGDGQIKRREAGDLEIEYFALKGITRDSLLNDPLVYSILSQYRLNPGVVIG